MIMQLDAAAVDAVSGGNGLLVLFNTPASVLDAMDQALEDIKAAQFNAEIAAALSGN